MGPEGLRTILLVLGAVPRPAWTKQSSTQLERAKIMDEMMKQVTKIHAEKRVSFGLKHKNDSMVKEVSEILLYFPAEASVIVYR